MPFESTPPESLTDELDWRAFCYAAGELSPAAMAEFEQRLGSDQAAREALARAIELTQAIASAESLASVVRRPAVRDEVPASRRRAKALAWAAIGTAALAAAVAFWSGPGAFWFERGHDARPQSAEKLGRAERELAVAWSHTRSEWAIASDADFWFPAHLSSGEANSPEAAGDDPRDDSPDDSLVGPAPDWLLAAVAGLSPAGEDANPADPAQWGELAPFDSTPFDAERTEN